MKYLVSWSDKIIYFFLFKYIFTKTDHKVSHILNLNTFKMIEIIQSMFPNHSNTKLEISNKKDNLKIPNLEIKEYMAK